MNVLSTWILSLLGVIILGIAADLLLGGKLKNFCRSIFAAAAVLIIVLPLPTIINKGCSDIGTLMNSEIPPDNTYISASTDYIADKLEKGTEEALKKDGIEGIEVKITLKKGEYTEIERVEIFIKKLVIENEMLHINKYEYLKKKVTEFLQVEEEMIRIYE